MRTPSTSNEVWGKGPWRSGVLFLFLSLFFLLPALAFGQTVRPLIDENALSSPQKKAQGKIEYFNDSLESLYVTLSAYSFQVSEAGALSYAPLDPGIHLNLSEMSFRIGPKQSHYVFYSASADQIPAWFVVYATFSGFKERTKEGFKLQIELPHTIYLLPKRTLRKAELEITRAAYDPASKRVVLRVMNSGPAFGRILEADVSGGSQSVTQGGFPVFPGAARQVEISWDKPDPPYRIKLYLRDFKLEQSIGAAPLP